MKRLLWIFLALLIVGAVFTFSKKKTHPNCEGEAVIIKSKTPVGNGLCEIVVSCPCWHSECLKQNVWIEHCELYGNPGDTVIFEDQGDLSK